MTKVPPIIFNLYEGYSGIEKLECKYVNSWVRIDSETGDLSISNGWARFVTKVGPTITLFIDDYALWDLLVAGCKVNFKISEVDHKTMSEIKGIDVYTPVVDGLQVFTFDKRSVKWGKLIPGEFSGLGKLFGGTDKHTYVETYNNSHIDTIVHWRFREDISCSDGLAKYIMNKQSLPDISDVNMENCFGGLTVIGKFMLIMVWVVQLYFLITLTRYSFNSPVNCFDNMETSFGFVLLTLYFITEIFMRDSFVDKYGVMVQPVFSDLVGLLISASTINIIMRDNIIMNQFASAFLLFVLNDLDHIVLRNILQGMTKSRKYHIKSIHEERMDCHLIHINIDIPFKVKREVYGLIESKWECHTINFGKIKVVLVMKICFVILVIILNFIA